MGSLTIRSNLRSLVLVLLLFTGSIHVLCKSNQIKSESESEYSPENSENELDIDPRNFSLMLYTILSEVVSDSGIQKLKGVSDHFDEIRKVSQLIIEDFDSCEENFIESIPYLSLPFITGSKNDTEHTIAYEICCKIRKNISTDSNLAKILKDSSKYTEKEDFVKTSMESIDNFEDLSILPESTTGPIYSSTLDPHKGITPKKQKLRNFPYEDDPSNYEEESSDHLIFSFDVKAAPFMHSNTHQYIYTYHHHSDNPKCLGLTKNQLEMVERIQNVSLNAKNIPRVPLDMACTAMWFISQRWNFCPLAFRELMDIKKTSSVRFCDMIKQATPEKGRFLTKNLKLSNTFLRMKAIKILNCIEIVLRLNSRLYPDTEITSKDIADIIFKGDNDVFVGENEEVLYKNLRKNRVEKNFIENKEIPKNQKLGLRYPTYKRNRHNFSSLFDQIMYSGDEQNEDEEKNLIILPLEFKRSPHWTSDKHLGSNSKEVISAKTVLQTYYIPPPSTLIPNDVSNWITGPCSWLNDKYKRIPPLIVSISKKNGHNLHILNACEAIFALINDSGESCANIIVSAVFFVFSIENLAIASDICSETAIRANLPFYPKKDLKSTTFPTNQYELVILYEGLTTALCLELGIVLELEDIHQVIFSDYPTKNSLVPRTSLNYLLYRALKLPNDFGKLRDFWNWPTQMYTRISNKQAKVILSSRCTQLSLEIAQVTNEIEIMNDILVKARIDSDNTKYLDSMKSNSIPNKGLPKSNYLHHFNYDYQLTNIDSIETNLVKLERIRYDLILEKERINNYINSLERYIGHKVHDIPKEFTRKKFAPIYKPKVFGINLYDSLRLQRGIIVSRTMGNLNHFLDSEPMNKDIDEYPSKINYRIKQNFQNIKECSLLTNKGMDLAIYSQELYLLYFNIRVPISISCEIILKMYPNINIKDSFVQSAFSILNYKYNDIHRSDIEEIWLKLVPIFSIPSGDLFKTKFYKFVDYQRVEEFDSNEIFSTEDETRNSPSEREIILDDKDSEYSSRSIEQEQNNTIIKDQYSISKPRQILNKVKTPKDYSPPPSLLKEIFDLEYSDGFWENKNNKRVNQYDLKEEYKSLREKIPKIDHELLEIQEKLNSVDSDDKSRFYISLAKTLKEDKKNIKTRIIHLGGEIAETEVNRAEETGDIIPNNVRRLADLHKANSIFYGDVFKLKSDDSGKDHSKRILELEEKIRKNNIEMYKLIKIGGNDQEDPKWYSDMRKCLSSYVPFRKEVHSFNPSEGIKQFYLLSKTNYFINPKIECSRQEIAIYNAVRSDLKRLFAVLNIPVIRIKKRDPEMFRPKGLIDPRKMEYWQNLHAVLFQDKKTGCKYIKGFFKRIVPVKNLDIKEFVNSPVFIIWCANHVNSRLGNEDIWRNIFGLIWLVFYARPFKPKTFVWKNILLV
ncbi:transmembrane protein [Cryptosporidium felis]|nr:transmembrane protein [Cryptosporidium felis]